MRRPQLPQVAEKAMTNLVTGVVRCRDCDRNYIKAGNDGCPACRKEREYDPSRFYRGGGTLEGVEHQTLNPGRLEGEGSPVHSLGDRQDLFGAKPLRVAHKE